MRLEREGVVVGCESWRTALRVSLDEAGLTPDTFADEDTM